MVRPVSRAATRAGGQDYHADLMKRLCDRAITLTITSFSATSESRAGGWGDSKGAAWDRGQRNARNDDRNDQDRWQSNASDHDWWDDGWRDDTSQWSTPANASQVSGTDSAPRVNVERGRRAGQYTPPPDHPPIPPPSVPGHAAERGGLWTDLWGDPASRVGSVPYSGRASDSSTAGRYPDSPWGSRSTIPKQRLTSAPGAR